MTVNDDTFKIVHKCPVFVIWPESDSEAIRVRKWDYLDLHTDQLEVSGMVNESKVLRQWKWPQHYSITTQWQAVIL